MRYLLDTHTFIWWRDKYERLSPAVLTLLQDPENIVFLSFATVWEMQIKSQTGKMRFEKPLASLIIEEQVQNKLRLLPITLDHIWALEQFPLHHRDPFDRLLAAQAQVEGATLLTADAAFAAYAIPILW